VWQKCVIDDFVVVGRQFRAEMKIRVEKMIAGWTLSRVVFVSISQNFLGTAMMQNMSARQSFQRVVLQAISFTTQTTVQSEWMFRLRR
jgi:hypothetical protein